MCSLRVLLVAALAVKTVADCPGTLDVAGQGQVHLVPSPTGRGGAQPKTEVHGFTAIVSSVGSRAYFASNCKAGVYDNEEYLAINLLDKTLSYTVDLTSSGCGCNAALYLVSMRQNADPSRCGDHYCDANSVCGVSCAEIDIQEANRHAWHSTLHGSQDRGGIAVGYGGGGSDWSGPRDFGPTDYGPNGACIDTGRPFQVATSFPVDGAGRLLGMEVTLSQEGSSCPLTMKIHDYTDMAELSQALSEGMTPVVTYWSDPSLTWLDGKGRDGGGPCGDSDDAAPQCGDSVQFSNFSIDSIATFEDPNVIMIQLPAAQVPYAWAVGAVVKVDLGGMWHEVELIRVEDQSDGNVQLEARLLASGRASTKMLGFCLVLMGVAALLATVWWETGSAFWSEKLADTPLPGLVAAGAKTCEELWAAARGSQWAKACEGLWAKAAGSGGPAPSPGPAKSSKAQRGSNLVATPTPDKRQGRGRQGLGLVSPNPEEQRGHSNSFASERTPTRRRLIIGTTP
mmetsp:Transcript_46453/g.101419  ORF Transcript_46453/g.101419 Transcript_46453/m.101419 type:complete len:511 (-) Transcript_46453:193-1725(-)